MVKITNTLFFIFLIFTSCFAGNQDRPIRVLLPAKQVSLWPLGIVDQSALWVARQINCQLVRTEGSVVKYEAAKDIKYLSPTELTVTLDASRKFPNGHSITADDVIASFKFLDQPKHVLRNVLLWIKEIKKSGTDQIIFELKKPMPQFLEVLSYLSFPIFEKNFLKRAISNKELWQKPVGCGGYHVIKNNKKSIVLAGGDKKPKLEFILNETNEIDGDKSSDYDIFSLHVFGNKKKLKQFKRLEILDPYQIYMGFNVESKHWGKKQDRCDFFSSLDRSIVAKAYGDSVSVATDFFPHAVIGYNYEHGSVDLSRRAYLLEQGTKDHSLCLAFLAVSIPQHLRDSYIKMIKQSYPDIKLKIMVINETSHLQRNFWRVVVMLLP